METFLLYLFKSGICLVLFYICMRAFLSNETFFRFNRWVLLIGTTICLLLPFVRIHIDEATVVQKPFAVVEQMFVPSQNEIASIQENFLTSKEIIEPLIIDSREDQVNIGFILLAVYLIGFAINLIILLKSVYLMLRLINRGRKLKHGEHILVLVSKDIVPFSWDKYIVLSVTDFESYPDEIITHEVAHAKYRHSLDLIYFELILLFQWFNPAIWLLKRELKDVHEYQADMSVLKSGINATKYQLLLVKKAVGASSYTLANSFNHSKIKKRITMMLKEKSNKWARLKLLLLLPLGTLTVFAFARPDVNEPLSSLINYESTNILQKTKIAEDIVEDHQRNEKPDNYNPAYYTVDGVKVSDGEYKDLRANSVDIRWPEYVPFAKGKVLKIQGIFNTGMKSPEYFREMFIDGKSPDRSHVYLVVNGTKYGYEEGLKKLVVTKPMDPKKPFKCQIISRDGSKSSPIFDVVSFAPPTLPEKMQKSVVDTKQQRDSVSKVLQEYIEKNGYKSEDRIGKPEKGKFKILVMSSLMAEMKSTVFPKEYNKKDDGIDANYLRIYWYVIDGKKYSWNKFMDKCRYGKVFFERNKIKPEDGQIVEMYGITTDGAKTPIFYMVGNEN
ncbi:M56 family metallopeptidase [Dysgonomonas sp. Marseille-P4677]|uniref:M56 family metallopeptidase n=1 Tax=Dysgonomonas sp. Marseille-P4677 TaxID=2364790 RepID=UPI0019125A0A|nr:M56 family metallopeptidase [Dysgonomonas sp. Marseille-P4677]MBK5721942.1 M56 family metallopeptidase [Dysgonomonas sp. Marseille-P4677]